MEQHLPSAGILLNKEVWKIVENGLHERHLDGMISVVQLAIELRSLRTVEELLHVLETSRNAAGNFELITKDVAAFHRIMGNSPPGYYPTQAASVSSAGAIRETVQAIRAIRQEIMEAIRQQLMTVLSAPQEANGGSATRGSHPTGTLPMDQGALAA